MILTSLKLIALLTTAILMSATAISAPLEVNTQTSLMHAAYEGDVVAMKQLLGQGVNPDEQNNMGTTALYYAAGASKTGAVPHGSVEAVRLLLEKGANANAHSKINGFNILMTAVNNDNIDTTALLLKFKAEVNTTTKDGRCALGMAAMMLNPELVNLLLDYHADTNHCTDSYGNSPLFNAIEAEPSVAETYAIARVNQQEAQTAIKRDAPKIANALMVVRSLIAHGAVVNVTNINGRTPLSSSVSQANHLIVKELLDAGANTNVTDKSMSGSSPLILAAQIRNVTIATMLLQHGAKVDSKDQFGKSAFDYARTLGPPKMVEILQARLKR
ncbi:MAG: ankyrin repeat domain-containing protein [Gallionellaceae bacterium]|jgi:ankyrin repeat protein